MDGEKTREGTGKVRGGYWEGTGRVLGGYREVLGGYWKGCVACEPVTGRVGDFCLSPPKYPCGSSSLILVNHTQLCQMPASRYRPLPEGSLKKVAAAGAVPKTITKAFFSSRFSAATPSAAASPSAIAVTLAPGHT